MTLDPLLLSGIVAAVVLAYVGRGINGMIFPDGLAPTTATGWRETWRRWMWTHPIIGGVLIGLVVPGPDILPGVAGAMLWYAGAGALALPIYRRIERRLGEGCRR